MKSFRRLRRVAKLVGLGLMVAAISQEMAKPEGEREWHGRLFGVIPYDFRPPSWERLRDAYWNPSNPSLFTPRVLGVGWAVNLYRAKATLEGAFEALMGGVPVRKVRSSAG